MLVKLLLGGTKALRTVSAGRKAKLFCFAARCSWKPEYQSLEKWVAKLWVSRGLMSFSALHARGLVWGWRWAVFRRGQSWETLNAQLRAFKAFRFEILACARDWLYSSGFLTSFLVYWDVCDWKSEPGDGERKKQLFLVVHSCVKAKFLFTQWSAVNYI